MDGLRRENPVSPNCLVVFMRVNEQEAANEPAEWHKGGVMDGRGLRRRPPEGGDACFIHLSFFF